MLISGRGSNLQAIIDAIEAKRLDAEIAVVISNRADAAGSRRAHNAGIETLVLAHADKAKFPAREDYDRELARLLTERNVGLVCLAGFMRLLTKVFLDRLPERGHQHPSVASARVSRHERAVSGLGAWGEWTGATVHLVTTELDGGPIVLQETVPVKDGDDVETLAARILERSTIFTHWRFNCC